MRLMLDTHVLLWWRDAARPLSRRARATIADGSNQILVSIASLWEITIKRALGKIAFADDLEIVLQEERFDLLSISFEHLRALDALPCRICTGIRLIGYYWRNLWRKACRSSAATESLPPTGRR